MSIRSQSLNAQAEQVQRLVELHQDSKLVAAVERTFIEPGEKLSFEEACLAETYLISALAIFQNQYKHHALGMDSDWDTFQSWVEVYFATDFARNWWKDFGHNHWDKGFGKEIDKAIEKIESSSESDYWEHFVKNAPPKPGERGA